MEGYAKLAELMGDEHTDGHFLIFQKFECLSAQNLLYLQAELINLQEGLNAIVKSDCESSDPEKVQYTQDWEVLSSSKDSPQWEKWLEIRGKLKEYYEAISQHRMITSLPAPSSYDLKFLQQWLERPNLGNCTFVGGDCDVYESGNSAGLAALGFRRREEDALTRSLVNLLPGLYQRLVVAPLYRICGRWIKKPAEHFKSVEANSSSPKEAPRTDANNTLPSATASTETPSPHTTEDAPIDLESNSHIFLYRDSHLYRIATAFVTLLSSLLPIVAIIVLSFVKNLTARLGIVCAFTAVFSVSLSLVTEGRRVEIFAATAAFASVQVVFVGSAKWGDN